MASSTEPPEPLKNARFQRRKKIVRDANGFRDVGRRLDRSLAASRDFRSIVLRLTNGEALLQRHYRARIDDPASPDHLLDRYGVKHLHLVRQDSDDILYCIEYKQLVLLLQVAGHVHLDAESPGLALMGSFADHLRDLSTYQRLGLTLRGLGELLGIRKK